jgi:uncharacterized protein (DUF302 family)
MDDLKYEVVTDKSFSEAVSAIIKSLEEQKLEVWKLNFKEKLHEKGIDLDTSIMILEACEPRKTGEIMADYPDVGYFLPCKVAVYEVKGSVIIGMVKPKLLISMLGYEDIDNTAKEMEEILKRAIDNAV